MKEKVSIYIPAFNAEKTIELSLNSIFSQSVVPDEVIVINDSSTDLTIDKIKKYTNLKIISNNKNMGLSYNRNLAIKESKNEIVGSIDADVVLEKYWLEKLLNQINKNNIVMCGGKMIEKLLNNNFNAWRAKYYSQNWGNDDKINPPFLYGCNTILLKSIWEKVSGYNEVFLTNGEDVDFSHRVRSLGNSNIFYSSEALCHHLQDDNINTLSKRIWRYHSFGYKIKKPSFLRLIKLTLKQFKFLINRLFTNLFSFKFSYIVISLMIFINFIKLEAKHIKKIKK